MGLDAFPVRQLVDEAVDGRIDVPEFQRAFVWRPDQVRALADSLFRGYPVGQILTWDNPEYAQSRVALDGRGHKQWLVDGQQRATALCLLFGRKPYWWPDPEDWNKRLTSTSVLANVGTPEGPVEFGLANPVRSADPRWVLVRDLVGGNGAAGSNGAAPSLAARAAELHAKLPPPVREKLPVAELEARLTAIWELRNREIPVASVQHAVEDVAEIFARLNQQGTEVREADVSLAVASSLRPGWVREEFIPFTKNLAESGYDLEPGIVIRVLTSIGEGKPRLADVSRGFWKDPLFDHIWGLAKESLSAVTGEMMAAGLLSSATVPARNALIPLAVLRAKYAQEGFQFKKAFHWFLMANRAGRYSTASTSALTEDVKLIRNAEGFPEALEALRGGLDVDLKVAASEFLEPWSWNRPLLLLMYLTILDHGAVDWATGQPIGKSNNVPEFGFVPHWHYFFPPSASVLRATKFDFSDEEVRALANVVLLSHKPKGRPWSTSPPAKYVREAKVTARQLEQQFLPLDSGLWEPERYRDFLAERSKSLARAVNKYLAGLFGAPS